MKQTLKGAVVASAVAAMFAIGAAQAQGKGDAKAGDKEKKVHCAGVNSCKGQGECSSKDNGCAGQNSCKGKAWVAMTEKECKAKGGKVTK